jgi:hypothetical protein
MWRSLRKRGDIEKVMRPQTWIAMAISTSRASTRNNWERARVASVETYIALGLGGGGGGWGTPCFFFFLRASFFFCLLPACLPACLVSLPLGRTTRRCLLCQGLGFFWHAGQIYIGLWLRLFVGLPDMDGPLGGTFRAGSSCRLSATQTWQCRCRENTDDMIDLEISDTSRM